MRQENQFNTVTMAAPLKYPLSDHNSTNDLSHVKEKSPNLEGIFTVIVMFSAIWQLVDLS
jgi:hypothetical protein